MEELKELRRKLRTLETAYGELLRENELLRGKQHLAPMKPDFPTGVIARQETEHFSVALPLDGSAALGEYAVLKDPSSEETRKADKMEVAP